MFEKEAEENANQFIKNHSESDKFINCKRETDNYNVILAQGYELGFQKGAEFGYNKANEWHYVKDEFPPENVPLNIITLDKNKKRRLWIGEYKGGNGEYWSGYFNHFIDVPYAWKEIVLPELKEEK